MSTLKRLLQDSVEPFWRAAKFTASGLSLFLAIAIFQSRPTWAEAVKGAWLSIAIIVPFSLVAGVVFSVAVRVFRFAAKLYRDRSNRP